MQFIDGQLGGSIWQELNIHIDTGHTSGPGNHKSRDDLLTLYV